MNNIRISQFAQPGEYYKERVILRATRDTDIGSLLLMCSPDTPGGKIEGGNKITYWFPDKQIKNDDLVVLYTKTGINSTKDLGEGRTAHFFYWGASQCMWGAGNSAVLLSIEDWESESSAPSEST